MGNYIVGENDQPGEHDDNDGEAKKREGLGVSHL